MQNEEPKIYTKSEAEAEKAALQAEVERLKREIENMNEAHQHACMIRRRGRE